MAAPKRVKNPIADLEKQIAVVEAALEKARVKALASAQKELVSMDKSIAAVEKKLASLTAKGAKRTELSPHQKELARLQKARVATAESLATVEQKVVVAAEVAKELGASVVTTKKPARAKVTAKKVASDVANKTAPSPAKTSPKNKTAKTAAPRVAKPRAQKAEDALVTMASESVVTEAPINVLAHNVDVSVEAVEIEVAATMVDDANESSVEVAASDSLVQEELALATESIADLRDDEESVGRDKEE